MKPIEGYVKHRGGLDRRPGEPGISKASEATTSNHKAPGGCNINVWVVLRSPDSWGIHPLPWLPSQNLNKRQCLCRACSGCVLNSRYGFFGSGPLIHGVLPSLPSPSLQLHRAPVPFLIRREEYAGHRPGRPGGEALPSSKLASPKLRARPL